MKLSILSSFNASILFEYEAEKNNLKITLQAALKNGANLEGADLEGANLKGANLKGEKLTKTPLQINNLKWPVLISDKYLRIGCQRFTIEEWKNFDDAEIVKMDFAALKFWRNWKAPIIALCDAHTTAESTEEGKEA